MEKFGGFDLFLFMVIIGLVALVSTYYHKVYRVVGPRFNDSVQGVNSYLMSKITRLESIIEEAKMFEFIYLDREYDEIQNLRIECLEYMSRGSGDSITNNILRRASELQYNTELLMYKFNKAVNH